MRKSSKLLSVAVALASAHALSGQARAVDHTWVDTSVGVQDWSNVANWGGTGTPSLAADGANLNVNLASDLAISLPAPVVIGKLTIGGSGAAVTTDVGNANAGGGTLGFDNTGGTGNATILSVGAGTNVISAPVLVQGNLNFDAASTRDLTIAGSFTAFGAQRQVTNLSTAAKVTISGPINLADSPLSAGFVIAPHQASLGDIVLAGNLSSNGASGGQTGVTFGSSNQNGDVTRRATITLSGDNSAALGGFIINRVVVVAGSNTAFGLATGTSNVVQFQGGSNSIGANLASNDDARTLPNIFQMTQAWNFVGDRSLTLTGNIVQTASRTLTNTVTGTDSITGLDRTLTLGKVATGNSVNTRVLTVDGPGRTSIEGVYNPVLGVTNFVEQPLSTASNGSLVKQGTGKLIIRGTSTYAGTTRVRGGLLEFNTIAGAGVVDAGVGATSGSIRVEQGAAVGLTTGSLDSAFLARVALNSAGGNGGVLALAPADAAVAIDYTATGNLGASGLQNLGLGAVEAGTNYAGAITLNSATYRLGGGGTLTLANPSNNQLTGANSVVLQNGGKVVLQNANDYTGTTTVGGTYILPQQEVNKLGNTNAIGTLAVFTRVNATLSVAALADGGLDSPIGKSTGDAANLQFNGGTLEYTGSGSTTDRLFTIHPSGATVDSSGTGALVFSNAGAVAVPDVVAANGTTGTNALLLTSTVGGAGRFLKPGMTVTGTGIAANTTITSVQFTGSTSDQFQLTLSANATASTTYTDLVFGNQSRTLTLTGSNTAANAIAGALADSASGKLSIVKNGAGRWNLTGSNTFTGGVTVNAGTLGIGKLIANGNVAVNAGAKLQLGPGSAIGDASLFGETANTLTLNGTGTLDVNKSGAVFDYDTTSPEATILAQIVSGRAGNWTGTGITSAAAAASPGKAVGYIASADASAGFAGVFMGQAFDATAVLVRYTLAGDATLDGTVNFDDLLKLAASYNNAGKWSTGDFNYDGTVNFDDLLLLAANYNASATSSLGGDWALAQAAVPEPTSLAAIAVAGSLALRRRRRY